MNMATTPELPMPEVIAYRQTVEFQSEPGRVHTFIFPIDEHPRPIGAEDVCTLADAIAYADSRCAVLQAERDALAARVKAMEDNDRRYRHYRDNSTTLLCVRADRYGGLNNVRIEGRFLDELTDAAIDAAGAQS
jgi:hypothetical protein